MITDTLPLEDTTTEVVETTQPDDIRSTIKSAIEAQRGGEDAVAETQKTTDEKQRARDEAGRFAAEERAKEAKGEKQSTNATSAETAQVAEVAQPNDGVVRPPPGWSPKSKAAFDSLPSEVKADIAKREGEVNQGFARLQEYKGLEAFAERAKNEGTTLATAVANYDRWESNFKSNPVTTALHMAKNLGISPVAWANAVLQKAGGQPQQAAIGQQPDQGTVQIPPALLAKIQQLESTVMTREQREADQQRNATAQNVNTFFSDPANKYADNVSEEMVGLINQAKSSGKTVSVADLATIYETACYMNPEVRALVINDHKASLPGSNPAKAIAQRAQQANKAVTGAPSRGAPPAGNAANPDASIRDTIKAAIAAQRDG